jgi:exonuclease SbcD
MLKKNRAFHIDTTNQKSTLDLFTDFYQEMTTSSFTVEKKQLMTKVIEDLEKNKKGGF